MQMSNEKVRELLDQLQQELERTEIDSATLSLAKGLDADIQQLIESGKERENVMGKARDVEARFAVEHPVAEKMIREIINTLGRIGV